MDPGKTLRFVSWLVLIALAVVLPARSENQRFKRAQSSRVHVFLTVDQLRADYLEKLELHLPGGLGRLMREGAWFREAHHEHANTETGPGHATLATGSHPARHGVIGNGWYDRTAGASVYCVEDAEARLVASSRGSRNPMADGAGYSPRLLVGQGLPDWIKSADARSKVFSIGGKDRSTVLTGGQKPDGAFWYHRGSGKMVTSTHYASQLPDWAARFVAAHDPADPCGKTWSPLPLPAGVADAFGLEEYETGAFDFGFPHALGGLEPDCGSSFYRAFGGRPFFEDHLIDFAVALLEAEKLGEDEVVDFLAVNLSVLDYVGHEFGSNGREALDTLLRLDASLARLLSFLDERIGSGRYSVSLSSDHGVMPFPEVTGASDADARRLGAQDVACMQGMERALDARFGSDRWLLADGYLNYQAIGRANVRRQDVEDEVRRFLERCEAVQRVWTRTELEAATGRNAPSAGARDWPFAAQVKNFHRERSGDFFVQYEPHRQPRMDWGATHGSPYRYDTHVPLLLVSPGVATSVVNERIGVVDLAPTVAALLGVPVPQEIDGRDLRPLLSPSRR